MVEGIIEGCDKQEGVAHVDQEIKIGTLNENKIEQEEL